MLGLLLGYQVVVPRGRSGLMVEELPASSASGLSPPADPPSLPLCGLTLPSLPHPIFGYKYIRKTLLSLVGARRCHSLPAVTLFVSGRPGNGPFWPFPAPAQATRLTGAALRTPLQPSAIDQPRAAFNAGGVGAILPSLLPDSLPFGGTWALP